MTIPAMEFQSTEGLSAEQAAALKSLLLGCADTKLLLGYHYGEWTFGTPALEAAIANCSLAQTELGHVRLLHAMLKSNFGEDPDGLVEQRAAGAFANVRFLDAPLPDWAAVVAANYVVDLAITGVLHAARESSFLPLRSILEKLLEEERYHAHHGVGWFRSCAARGGEACAAVGRRLDESLAAVADWMGPAEEPGDSSLVSAGVKARSNAEVFRDLCAEVRHAAGPYGIEPTVPALPSATTWQAATRRSRPGGPDAEILYHMRGSKNEVFKLR